MRLLLILVVACAGTPTPWATPATWKGESFPFPLEFAPGLAHRGVEELRFAPGMFDPKAPGYWSYAFVWRTDDLAALTARDLGNELTVYFRGLIASVDADKHRITAYDEIVVRATPEGETRFTLGAHLFDAFATGKPIDLTGWAERHSCGNRALWIFVFAPPNSPVRGELDALAAQAKCGQPLPPAPPPSGASK